jgi:hypothetical protein
VVSIVQFTQSKVSEREGSSLPMAATAQTAGSLADNPGELWIGQDSPRAADDVTRAFRAACRPPSDRAKQALLPRTFHP